MRAQVVFPLRALPVLLLLLIAPYLLSGCDDDTFVSSPANPPSFIADTLSFDTLISTIPSATGIAILRNSNDDDLLIQSIELESGGTTGFRINVDGQPGTSFSDIELWAKDSLYIFVEATLPATGNASPQAVSDRIIVRMANSETKLTLYAHSQDAIIKRGWILSRDTTLTSELPFVIYDSLMVDEGATLTIAENTRLMFHDKAELKVKGTLNCEGTSSQPIIMRGDRTDRLFSYLPYDRTPALWQGIHFYPTSTGNTIKGVDIHSAVVGIAYDSAAIAPTLEITDSRIHNNSESALVLNNCNATITNSLITNSAGNLVALNNGNYTFTHCSLLNFYAFSIRSRDIIAVANEGTQVSLNNCLLTSDPPTAVEANATITDHYAAHYQNINQDEDYRYDFRPTADNLGINKGEAAYSTAVPIDLAGSPRLADTAPDTGCFELPIN